MNKKHFLAYLTTTLLLGCVIGYLCGSFIQRIKTSLAWNNHRSLMRDFAIQIASHPTDEDHTFPSVEEILTLPNTSVFLSHLVYSPSPRDELLQFEDKGSQFIAWGFKTDPKTKVRAFIRTNLSIELYPDHKVDWAKQTFLK